jgi:hypothetical protein
MTPQQRLMMVGAAFDALNAATDFHLRCDHDNHHKVRPCGDTACVHCMCLESANELAQLREELRQEAATQEHGYVGASEPHLKA